MPDIKIDKEKFDALLQKMLKAPPLPKADIPRRRKKRKKPAA